MDALCALVSIYVLAIVARAILSWFPVGYGSPVASIADVLSTVTEPVLGPVRRALPSLGGFDISPIVVIVGLQVVAGIVLGC